MNCLEFERLCKAALTPVKQNELLTVDNAPYPVSVRGGSAPRNPCLNSAKTRRRDAMTFQNDPSCRKLNT